MSQGSIVTNSSAITARNIGNNNAKELSKTQRNLASGSKVNDPSNAASNAAIAQRMEAQNRGAMVASQNAAQAESLFQLGAGTAANINAQAQRMRELATQATNGLYGPEDIGIMNEEFKGLYAEIQREINTTLFNGNQILGATFEAEIQVGPNVTVDDSINIEAGAMDLQTPYNALLTELDTAINANNLNVVSELDTFINNVSAVVGRIGAEKAKMDVIGKNLALFVENNTAAKSIIADVDIPEELSKAQSLTALIDVSQTVLQATAESAKKLGQLVQNGLR